LRYETQQKPDYPVHGSRLKKDVYEQAGQTRAALREFINCFRKYEKCVGAILVIALL